MKPNLVRCLLALLLVGVVVLADRAWPAASQEPSGDTAGRRGPGMKGPATDHLKLPVPRTFDLSHVQPEHFAAALGKDPEKIFAFVRDHIAFEVYTGCLRGPRGTLLAMAGNAVDRAALLASLLERSGHKVRFAQGALPEAKAKELVLSMWVPRPQPGPPTADETPPALAKARETLQKNVELDFGLIRNHLQKQGNPPKATLAPSLESLSKEAQEHFWVQWHSGDQWVDLDPSFAGTNPAKTFAKLEKTMPAVPDSLCHWVELRLMVEEYPVYFKGDQATNPRSRVVLVHKAKAMDLSGTDLILTHQPENWKGLSADLREALGSAISNTGRIKPVLLTAQEQAQAGEPFRPNLEAGKGLGGITGLLGGDGSRTPLPVATAQFLHVDFIHPGGRKETVVREIYDLTGPARRAAKKNLSSTEVRERTTPKQGLDVALNGVYDLFFTTGRIDAVHFVGAAAETKADAKGPADLRACLRRINLSFAASSDSFFGRWRRLDGDAALFYPDSPRLSLVEHVATATAERIALDLRRDRVRIVTLSAKPLDLFYTRVFRGVVEGALERVVLESATSLVAAKEPKWKFPFSTSVFFDHVRAKEVPTLLLPRDQEQLGSKLPPDALARVRADLAAGSMVVTAKEALVVNGASRYAWWQIDPLTGETVALTDEGLHASTTTELLLVKVGKYGAVFYATARGGYAFVMWIGPDGFERVAAAIEKMGWTVLR